MKDRDVKVLAGAVALSTCGDWLALVPLLLQVERMESGLAVSALLICLWAPIALLAGHVGALVDRFETVRLLVAVSVAQGAVAVALALTIDSLPAVLILAALLGTGLAISQAAEFALVPVAAGTRVREANGLVETARYAGFTAGPLAGGLLASAAGVRAAMLVNAATFLAVAGGALLLRIRRPPQARGEGDVPPRARDGAIALFRDRTLGLAMTAAFGSLLFMSASIPADVGYVEHVLDAPEWGLGAMLTVWTLGMVAGANLVARRVAAGALAGAGIAAVILQGLGKAVAPAWQVLAFMLACYFVAGVAHGLKNVVFRTLIHERVPAAAHGRAFAAYNGLRNTAELGALAAGGVLVVVLGPSATLVVAGGGAALVGAAAFALLRRRARVPESPAATFPP